MCGQGDACTYTHPLYNYMHVTSALDIDECAAAPCDQFCTNTEGSFECSCRDGFTLSGQRNCESEYIMACETALSNATRYRV